MSKKELARLYQESVKGSINDFKHKAKLIDIDSRYYYDEQYWLSLSVELKQRFLTSKLKNRTRPILALSSPERLTYLLMSKNKAISFNHAFRVPFIKGIYIFWAFEQNKNDAIFYENVSDDLFENHKTRLHVLNSIIYKDIGIKSMVKKDNRSYIDFKDYVKGTHFKYFNFIRFFRCLTHIAAINRNEDYKNNCTLQYIYYKPIIKDKELEDAYERLNHEISVVWSDQRIIDFCKQYKISLPKPKFINICDIDDFVYEKAYKEE